MNLDYIYVIKIKMYIKCDFLILHWCIFTMQNYSSNIAERVPEEL